MNKFYVIFFALLLWGHLSLPQNPFIKNYTVTDGLPSNKIIDVYKDSQDFIWFATDAGVVRFDGSNFINYSIEDGLSGNLVMGIKEDSSGRLWFFNLNGTINFFYKNTIYNTLNAPFLEDLKTNFHLFDFYEDEDSTLYFFNAISEVFVTKNDELIDYKNFGFNNKNEIGLFNLNKSSDGQLLLWVGPGIYKTKGIDYDKELISQPDFLQRVFPKDNNECFVLDIARNVHLFRDSKCAKKNIFRSESLHINSILMDEEGLIWVSTFDKGVYCYKNDSNILHLDIAQAQGVSVDNENNIWISSSKSGIYKVNREILKYKTLGKEKFDNNGIIKLAHSYFDGIWATNGNSLFLVQPDHDYPQKLSLEGNILENIYEFKNRSIITNGIGNNMHIINNIGIKNGEIEFDTPKTLNLKVKRTAIDSSESTLYSFINDQLIILDLKKINTLYYISKRGRINNVFMNNKDELLINASTNYILKNDSIFYRNIFEHFNGQIITSRLILDSKNEVYNIFGNKLYLLNDDNFFELTKDFASQIDYRIKDMAYDGSTLFFFTIKTIYYIKNPINIIDNEELLLNRLNIEFNNINDIYCEDSMLYVASDDGLTFIPINDFFNVNTQPTNPYFFNVSLDEENYDFSGGSVIFKNKKRLSIDFSSRNYSSIPSNFSYMLMGTDENWINGKENRVVYLNLSPGEYTFKLKSRKNREEFSPTIELPIIVNPTLLQRTSFRILLLLLLLTALFLILRYFYRRQIIQRETDTLLITLEHKALQSMMNPHFIFNALGSIQNYLLQNKALLASNYLSQFARLIRQNMNSLKSNSISVEDEKERLINYLELEKLRLNASFDFTIEVDEEMDEYEIQIPAMIVQPYVENAIWHGISSLPFKGEILIKFKLNDDKSIYIIVEDNGLGIEKTKTFPKSDKNLNMGASLTEKRLKLIGERLKVNGAVTSSDLRNDAQYPGTKIVLKVPIIN